MNMTSFTEEFALIKLSEVERKKKTLARKVFENVGLAAVGGGLGFGFSELLSAKALPSIKPGLTTKQRRLGSLGLAAMGGLAGILAGRAAAKRERDHG